MIKVNPTAPGWTRALANWARAAAVKPDPLDDLPVVRLKPVADDEQVDFWNDIIYLRGLMDDIATECLVAKMADQHIGLNPLDACDTSLLDVAIEFVQRDFWNGWELVGVDLAAWRVERRLAVAA